jgi:hypothetical protein
MNHLNDAKRVQVTRQKVRILSTKQKIQFLNMLKRQASQFEFKNRMNLLPSDVGRLRRELEVETIRDMNRAITRLEKQLDHEHSQEIGKDHTMPIPKQEDLPSKQEKIIKDSAVINTKFPNFEETRIARRREQIFKVVSDNAQYCNFKIPEKEEDKFLNRLHLGKRVLSRMYSVPTIVIVKEAIRLNPKLDPDSINN